MSALLDGDLTWFFGDARGELGVHGVALEPSIRGTIDTDGVGTASMAAARKYRRIADTFNALPHDVQRILRRAHTPLLPKLRVDLAPLGELAAIVADEFLPQWLNLTLYWARTTGKKVRPQRDLARALIASAEAAARIRLLEAIGAYRSGRAAARTLHRSIVKARIRARALSLFGDARTK